MTLSAHPEERPAARLEGPNPAPSAPRFPGRREQEAAGTTPCPAAPELSPKSPVHPEEHSQGASRRAEAPSFVVAENIRAFARAADALTAKIGFATILLAAAWFASASTGASIPSNPLVSRPSASSGQAADLQSAVETR